MGYKCIQYNVAPSTISMQYPILFFFLPSFENCSKVKIESSSTYLSVFLHGGVQLLSKIVALLWKVGLLVVLAGTAAFALVRLFALFLRLLAAIWTTLWLLCDRQEGKAVSTS